MKSTFISHLVLALGLVGLNLTSYAQDTLPKKLVLEVPLVDFPQNSSLPQHYPSMRQSVEWSKDFYELAFWGLDALGNKIFIKKDGSTPKWRKISYHVFKYGTGLAFAQYGSELPIPLGVWAHEEFHRTTLGVANIGSKNGNWIFHRWDGTVYGVSDESLTTLKQNNLSQLLYSYVSGVQYETYLNQKITIEDTYTDRTSYKNPLLLYNAYYVYNYFRFATSPHSDSVKVIAPQYESSNPSERDYAGADLTAWAYDMYSPDAPYTLRDSFPSGEGVNRRVGFSDLSTDAQSFLIKQKRLSLLNFVNPAIFLVNKIKINSDLAFNIFAQYNPTHFGNDIGFYLPVRYKQFNLLMDVHSFNSNAASGFGLGLGIYRFQLHEKLALDANVQFWNQPQTFWSTTKHTGGSIATKLRYKVIQNLEVSMDFSYKSRGWQIGNPYLSNNASVALGLGYRF